MRSTSKPCAAWKAKSSAAVQRPAYSHLDRARAVDQSLLDRAPERAPVVVVAARSSGPRCRGGRRSARGPGGRAAREDAEDGQRDRVIAADAQSGATPPCTAAPSVALDRREGAARWRSARCRRRRSRPRAGARRARRRGWGSTAGSARNARGCGAGRSARPAGRSSRRRRGCRRGRRRALGRDAMRQPHEGGGLAEARRGEGVGGRGWSVTAGSRRTGVQPRVAA